MRSARQQRAPPQHVPRHAKSPQTAGTGWLPQHLLVRERAEDGGGPGRLLGCVPLYLKAHSYGEYVFDSAWADAADRIGVR